MQISPTRAQRRLYAALGSLFLFTLNAGLCHNLFHTEFTERMESIEGPYMSISHWAMNHWSDLSWFPLWFEGMPFHQVYQPGFQLTVAALGTVTLWTTQHAYHFFTALTYCLGPVTLFLLCYCATGCLGYSLTSGLLYSVVSPACLFSAAVRHDTNELISGRRFTTLVHYGEGPHVTAVMMIPLVLLVLHYGLTERRRWALALTPLALAIIPLSNWPGTMGLCLALAAYLVSRLGSGDAKRCLTLLGAATIAYLIACPWIPPSAMRLAQRNAQLSDATMIGAARVLGLLGILAGALALQYLFHRLHVNPWLRFFACFMLIAGVVSLTPIWFGWRLLPQGHRFLVEFEMAAAAVAAWLGKIAYERSPRFLRMTLAVLLVAGCAYEAIQFRRFAQLLTRPIDIRTTIEYRMARWFDAHMQGRRVFAPGNVALWMNLFTETPQMAGCCDQGIPAQEHRIANFAIYTGMNAGARDAEVSIMWLKAYGVDAIGVCGPRSTEMFHPFINARKFDGVLPVLWRDGDNAVYSVERRSRSLAHVVPRDRIVTQAPVNGLWIEPMIPYVNAIEAQDAPPASFAWLNLHQARIEAEVSPGDAVSVQISYDPGWQATIAGAPQRTFVDGLGLMVIDPHCTGHCAIDLVWDGGEEAKWTLRFQLAGMLLWVAWIWQVSGAVRRTEPRPSGRGDRPALPRG